MTHTKVTTPLALSIAGAIIFNLSPILFGYGMMMNLCFMVYGGSMIYLSVNDRRVLGYATVLTACNPANSLANLSFSFLLAILTILANSMALKSVIHELNKDRWWRLFFAAFLLIILSVPFWSFGLRSFITEGKQALSRLGYLVAFSLAVGLTFRTFRDGVRAMALLSLMSCSIFAIFYFIGQASLEEISAVVGGEAIGVQQYIGNISLNFVRTQVCIPIAVLAATTLTFGVCIGLNWRAIPFYLASSVCVYLILKLASTGSAFAMVCGIGVMIAGYSLVCLFSGGGGGRLILFTVIGVALYFAVFQTDNALSKRIELKSNEVGATGVDRQVYWEEGITEIIKSPFGEGWTWRTGHSDWLLFLLSYGWATGLLYIAAAGALFLSMWRALFRNKGTRDNQSFMVPLAGLAALSVYLVNANLDMLSANIGYYQTVWALILTPATVMLISMPSREPL
jgi:hypothetical protein